MSLALKLPVMRYGISLVIARGGNGVLLGMPLDISFAVGLLECFGLGGGEYNRRGLAGVVIRVNMYIHTCRYVHQ